MNETLVASTIDAIYDASTAPENWTIALERLSQCFGSRIATIIDRNVKTMEGSGVAIGVDAPSQVEFFTVWGTRNPFVQALKNKSPSVIDTDQDVLSKDALLASDYYNGFMRQRDMHSMLRITLQKDDELHRSISIMGPQIRGEFEKRDVERGQMFLPHLERAAKVTRHMTVATTLLQSVNSALESHPDGVILLNRSGDIVIANRAARAMADQSGSFILRNNRMAAHRSPENAKLQHLIAAATGRITGVHVARGDAMRLSRNNDQRDYLVVITALPHANTLYKKQVPVACIVITDPMKPAPHSPLLLKKLFGLTPTEARIAQHLTSGDTPTQTAESLNIAISTARTHIDSIFRKTEVSRQTDLVRLLVQLPPMPD